MSAVGRGVVAENAGATKGLSLFKASLLKGTGQVSPDALVVPGVKPGTRRMLSHYTRDRKEQRTVDTLSPSTKGWS